MFLNWTYDKAHQTKKGKSTAEINAVTPLKTQRLDSRGFVILRAGPQAALYGSFVILTSIDFVGLLDPLSETQKKYLKKKNKKLIKKLITGNKLLYKTLSIPSINIYVTRTLI